MLSWACADCISPFFELHVKNFDFIMKGSNYFEVNWRNFTKNFRRIFVYIKILFDRSQSFGFETRNLLSNFKNRTKCLINMDFLSIKNTKTFMWQFILFFWYSCLAEIHRNNCCKIPICMLRTSENMTKMAITNNFWTFLLHACLTFFA